LERFLADVEKRAFHYARVATGNEQEALDIVQDAMLKLVQRYADRDAQEWGPLFHRILQSRIRDWYRRSLVRNRLRDWFSGRDEGEDEPLEAHPAPVSEGPLEQLASNRFGIELERALNHLPNRQQQAFMLRAWEGLSVEETAQAMGCSAGSVKTHYSRALATLRQQLKEFENER
jgi:RNA polymerase sigma-70 factor (ECF subfamily)